MTGRLVGTYLAITAMVLLVLIVPLGRTFASREQDRLLAAIDRDTTVVGSLSEEGLEQGTPVGLDALLTGYGDDPGGRIIVVDARGISVADSDNIGGPSSDFSTRPEIRTALSGERTAGRRASETLGTDLLFVARPVESNGRILGAVRITYPAATLNDAILDNWLRLGLLSLVVLVAVAVVGVILARQVTRPVRDLESAVLGLAEGDLDQRVPDRAGPPELVSLGRSFNDMAMRLETLVASQRAFVANASHQLRTPLTALRLRLENLSAADPGSRAAVDSALAEIQRLSRLVDGLLAIARAEAGERPPEPVEIVAIAHERGDTWRPLAREADIDLDVVGPRAAWASAVPGGVEQMLDNLISNALEAMAEGGTVRVSVHSDGPAWKLRVLDDGPGMTETERERAFDRFYSKGKSGRGSGLGLAIVRQLAVASGGDAVLLEADGGGIDAVVRLRACTEPEKGPAAVPLPPSPPAR